MIDGKATRGKADSGMLIKLHLIIYFEDFALRERAGQCYDDDGKSDVSLSMEA